MLSINFLPNAVYNPETCIRATIESKAELDYLAGIGIRFFQGYYFAKPQLEYLVGVDELLSLR